jgi:gamma-glutamyltranspeptidase/glutathione hydrolase
MRPYSCKATFEPMNDLDFRSRRSPVYSTRGMVGASQPLAVAAGLEMLSLGGSAADAAVAAAAALAVTEPFSTGLGGDCFALFYDASTGRVSALNGSGHSPASLTLERIRRAGYVEELPPTHPYNITVPGTTAGWCDLLEMHGRLELSAVLAPAIRLADQGFPVAPLTAQIWDECAEDVLKGAPGGQALTISGRAPRAGELFRNPSMAEVLRVIAADGKRAFYEGEIAERIAHAVQSAGGCLDTADLSAHQSSWETPISITYRGVRIWECPPNGQGLAALLALNILEGFDLPALEALSAHRLHLEIEAMRLAFADARWYVCDPAFDRIPLQPLLSKDYAAQRRALIDPLHACLDREHGSPPAASDTVYLSVVDGQGNACSFINSLYMGFGTGVVPDGCGFALQNRGFCFSLDPAHPNVVAPGKRPYHTIIPALATLPTPESPGSGPDGESLYACFGVMGGFMQPQGHLQVFTGLVDDGLDPQSALDRPRFCIQDGQAGAAVALEEGIPVSEMSALAEMGHPVVPVSGTGRSVFGRGQIILRDPESGVLCGGSDPRADGCVMTY